MTHRDKLMYKLSRRSFRCKISSKVKEESTCVVMTIYSHSIVQGICIVSVECAPTIVVFHCFYSGAGDRILLSQNEIQLSVNIWNWPVRQDFSKGIWTLLGSS